VTHDQCDASVAWRELNVFFKITFGYKKCDRCVPLVKFTDTRDAIMHSNNVIIRCQFVVFELSHVPTPASEFLLCQLLKVMHIIHS